MIVIDASRTLVSLRGSRQYDSPALQSNALHFGSDLAGSIAVLLGLVFVAAGFPGADSLAALFVAVLALLAAARLMRGNIDVLMDRSPADADAAARAAIQRVEPPVELRRLRLRRSAGASGLRTPTPARARRLPAASTSGTDGSGSGTRRAPRGPLWS